MNFLINLKSKKSKIVLKTYYLIKINLINIFIQEKKKIKMN